MIFWASCLFESCVRLYILCIYVFLFIEHIGNVSPENVLPEVSYSRLFLNMKNILFRMVYRN